MIIRTYEELITFPTFEERYRYLRLVGHIGEDTFGYDRYMNQMFYRSLEWKRIRDQVILRDNGCDLGIEGRDIFDKIIIHHMNPISVDDIKHSSDNLMNPRYLVCTSINTHNAIHYGYEHSLAKGPAVRTKYDTCPWRTPSNADGDFFI